MLRRALQALQTSRGPIPLRSDDIVAGEREVTLGLLWRIFQHFEASRQSVGWTERESGLIMLPKAHSADNLLKVFRAPRAGARDFMQRHEAGLEPLNSCVPAHDIAQQPGILQAAPCVSSRGHWSAM